MSAPLPTPAEVEGMRERHEAQVVDGLHYCLTCEVSAPCDAARLLALVKAQGARLAAVLALCDRMEHEYPYRRGEDIDRVRRAATGEPS